jgi:hypothetical protein
MASTPSRVAFFRLVARFIHEAALRDIDVMPYSFLRTAEEQNKLYLDKKSLCDGYVQRSKHQDGLAIDLVVIIAGKPIWGHVPDYDILGEIWTQLGGKWGGNFQSVKDDIFHFEAGA